MASLDPDDSKTRTHTLSPPASSPQLLHPTSHPVPQGLPSDFQTLIEIPIAKEQANNKRSDHSSPAKQQHRRRRRHERDALPQTPKTNNNEIRQTHNREFAIGLVYHEAISKGATIQQARRAVEVELLTQARAKQLEAVRAMPHYHQRRWDWHVDQNHHSLAASQPGSRSGSRRPHGSNNKHSRRKRSKLRRLGRAPRPRSSWSETSSWEDELPPARPVPLPFRPQMEPSRGRPITRTPSGSPARDREPNRRHLHMSPPPAPPFPAQQQPFQQGPLHPSSNSESMANAGRDSRRGGRPSSSQHQQQQQHARSATTNTAAASYSTYDADKSRNEPQIKPKSEYTMTPALSSTTYPHHHSILHVVGSGSSAHANRCMRTFEPRRESQFDEGEEGDSVKTRCSWWRGRRSRSRNGRRSVCGSLRGMRRGSRRVWAIGKVRCAGMMMVMRRRRRRGSTDAVMGD